MRSNILFGIGVILVAAIHFVASFFVAFAAGVGGGRVYHVLTAILTFPLSFLPPDFDALGFLPWVVLSLCWGIAVCLLLRAVFPTSVGMTQ